MDGLVVWDVCCASLFIALVWPNCVLVVPKQFAKGSRTVTLFVKTLFELLPLLPASLHLQAGLITREQKCVRAAII